MADAASRLGRGAGGGGPLNFRACAARRRRDGVASSGPSGSRRQTQRESGDGCLHPHGEKGVGDATSQRPRKPPDTSRSCDREHIGVEPGMMVRVASALRGAHTPCHTCSPKHKNACMKAILYYMTQPLKKRSEGREKWGKGLDNSGNIEGNSNGFLAPPPRERPPAPPAGPRRRARADAILRQDRCHPEALRQPRGAVWLARWLVLDPAGSHAVAEKTAPAAPCA